jgi:hypothetical protein
MWNNKIQKALINFYPEIKDDDDGYAPHRDSHTGVVRHANIDACFANDSISSLN